MRLPRPLAILILLPALALPAAAQSVALPHGPELRWRMIGPFRGGRTRALAGVPLQPNVFYIGQVDGGVWKTDDAGRTWNPIFDAQPTQSIGAIAIAPSDPNILYVASGEGLHRPDLSVGNGIYKSTDAGQSWTHLGLHDGQQIPALAVDPKDPSRLFAAVLGHPYGPNPERGIYRSTDGGVTWKKVLGRTDAAASSVGGSDVLIDPLHPNVVYASLWQSRLGPWEDGNQYDGTAGGLFKSVDGGDTWQQLTKGLPADLSQINIAISPSNPSRLFATLATTRESGYASAAGLGVYRSDDAGESWQKITDDPRPAMKIGGGDLPVPKVDPQNPDVVYSTSIVTCRSTDGGKTWTSLRGAPGGDDYQNIWINPHDSNTILLVSDQGAVVSVNGGATWTSWYNQPTAQLYHVAATNTFPYKVCAGQQESGSVCISSRGNDGEITFRDWHPAGIIEYGYAAPDPLHPEIVFGAGRNEVSRYNAVTGQVQNVTPIPLRDGYRTTRTEPILFSPVDPHRLYYAANLLFESIDSGASWRPISPDLTREHAGRPASLPDLPATDEEKRRGSIFSVAASYKNANTLWAGTDDGLLWITRTGGLHWKNITPPEMIPWSKVTQLSASHFDDNTAYAAVSRFRIDDLRPYLYRTHDGGATWQSISSGLPADAPVNTVREDPVRKGLLFAGTETEVWFSLDDGDHWQSLQLNLPHTSMRDLAIKDNDLIVATHGRSFWILDDISSLRQLDAPGTQGGNGAYLFKPGAAWRVRRSTNTDTPLPADEPAGENPPDGAVIDYALPANASGPVSLEILDNFGKLVRRYASTDVPPVNDVQLKDQLIPLYWIRMPRILPATPGMHRWVWDLRYAPPTSSRYEYPISAVPHRTPRTPQGPLVLPGVYIVRLTANGTTTTAPLTVKMDPRVPATRMDLQQLASAENHLADLVNSSSLAVLAAHAAREQVAAQLPHAQPALADTLKSLNTKLGLLLDGPPPQSAPATGGSTPAAEAAATPQAPQAHGGSPAKGTPVRGRRAPAARSAEPGEGPDAHEAGLDDLNGEILTLYAQVGQADAPPTPAQARLVGHVGVEWARLSREWDQLRNGEIAEVNRQLNASHQPALNLERQPRNMPEGGDED